MADPHVQRWRQRGTVYLWRYRDNYRNYPGWNLSAEAAGCTSLLELLDLMIASEWSSQATIRTSEPSKQALQASNDNDRWRSVGELSLHHPKGKVGPAHWRLEEHDGGIVLTLGEDRLAELRRGVVDVSKGEGEWAAPNDDESIDDKQLLYFWPVKWARYSSRYGR